MNKLFLLAALALFAGACVVSMDDESERPLQLVDGGDDGRTVTLSIAVPGQERSRAMSTTLEDAVETIDVLLFHAATNRFGYRAIGTKPDATNKFSVKLPGGDWTVVVLANARDALASIPPATLHAAPGTTNRETFLDALVMTLPANVPWSDARNLPMWGYYKTAGAGVAALTLHVDQNTSTIAEQIRLTRAIARVDVSVSAGAKDNFTLTSVRLYNRNRSGSLAPLAGDPAVNDGYDPLQWDGGKAKAPHLPAAPFPEPGPLLYTVPPAQQELYEREIYTFETEEGSVSNTCLVIGGMYKADPSSSATLTYYRVDFVDNNDDPLALLRNHRYKVTIQAVNGPGYPGWDDAYTHEPANIIVTIIPWDEGDLNNIKFNDQHYLAVDKRELVFYKEESDRSLVAVTNFPDDWAVDASSFPPWLSIVSPNPAVGANNEPTTLTLRAEALAGNPAREYQFYITAGILEKLITVRQLDEKEFSLEVSPWEMTFYKTPRASKTITLTPVPDVDEISYFFTLDVKGNITWGNAGSSHPTIVGNSVTLKPDVNDSGATRGSTVLVTLGGPDGQAVTRVVNVRQLDRDINFTATPANPYPATGVSEAANESFPVSSETWWKLSTLDPDLTLENKPGYYAAATNYPFHFSLAANPLYVPRDIMVNVTSSDEDLAAAPFPIEQQAEPPAITITDPSGLEHDFGSSETARQVAFTTNAKWKFSIDDLTFDNIIASVTGATKDVANDLGAKPTVSKPGSVTFTPLPPTDPASAAAGVQSTKVTFSTVNPDAATEDTKQVTFKRFVPAYFLRTGYSPSTNIPAVGGDVTFTANSNLVWYAQQASGAKQYSGSPAGTPPAALVTGDQVTVSVPALPVTDASSWWDTGSLMKTFYVGYDAQSGLPAIPVPQSYTIKQQYYYLNVTPLDDITDDFYNYTTTVTLNVSTDAASYKLNLTVDGGGPSPIATYTGSESTITIDVNRIERLTGVTPHRTVEILNGYSGILVATFTQYNYVRFILTGPVTYNNLSCPPGYKLLIVENQSSPDDSWVGNITIYNTSGARFQAGTTYAIAYNINTNTGKINTAVHSVYEYIDSYNQGNAEVDKNTPVYYICVWEDEEIDIW